MGRGSQKDQNGDKNKYDYSELTEYGCQSKPKEVMSHVSSPRPTVLRQRDIETRKTRGQKDPLGLEEILVFFSFNLKLRIIIFRKEGILYLT